MDASPFNTETPSPAHAWSGLTLVNGRTFTVARGDGTVAALADGTMFEDLRMLATFTHRVSDDGHELSLECLGVSTPTPFHAVTVFRPDPGERPGEGEPTELCVHRQWVGRGVRHDLEIQNNGATPITRSVAIRLATDFAHLFDVKAGRPRGDAAVMEVRADAELSLRHLDPGVDLEVRIRPDRIPDRVDTVTGTITWDLSCEPRSSVQVSVTCEPVWDGQPAGLLFPLGPAPGPALPARAPHHAGTEPTLISTDARLSTAFERALADLASLRIFDPSNPTNTVIAAGAPWFMTLFGRDSLLSAWMALPLVPDLAVGVLRALGELQGTATNPTTEEEPGKILHELRRHGGHAAFADRGRYYGTVDATPLYVMLAAEASRWGHLPAEELRTIAPNIAAATGWVRRAVARHPHGFLAYQRSTETGLLNQGWKDSWDGVTFADGRLPSGSIALAEVQGYAYAALLGAAELADRYPDALDLDPAELRREANELCERFNAAFWHEPQSSYAVGVTADGTPIDTVTTNPGHALWCGVADPDLAGRYLDRAVDGDLWSGWGLRTLSPAAAAYNPLSYHNGSVWPHDTALVAAGAAQVGRFDAVDAIVDAALDAAACFDGRPPELFAGVHRDEIPAPVRYPSSCSPQAWSSASILLHLRSLVGLGPPAGENDLPRMTRPDAPDGDLTLAGVIAGGAGHRIELVDGAVDLCRMS